MPLAQLAQQNEDYNEVLQLNLNLLNTIMPNNSVTVNEIEEWNEDVFTDGSDAENSDEEASDSSDVDIVDITPAISHTKVFEGINNVIKWCETSDIFYSKHSCWTCWTSVTILSCPYIYLALTPEIWQVLGRFLICGTRKQEQT